MAADPDWPTQEKLLKWYGAYLLTNAPKNIQQGTRLVQARYMYTQWCEVLKDKGGMINCDALSRIYIRDGQFTCSWHAERLQAIFEGWGIDGKEMFYTIADSDSYLPTPNSDHGALTLRDNDGRSYVFDPWKMATDQFYGWPPTKLYSGAANSPYNGMPVDKWGDLMTKEGYVRFSGDLAETWQPTAVKAVDNHFNPPVTIPAGCEGCEIRNGWEILGYDMSHCDNCPNDERKKNAAKPTPVPVDPCARCAIYIPGEDMSGCEKCPRVK
jgi:hypothetical protein